MQVQLTASEAREETRHHCSPTLEELARQGARQMLAWALDLKFVSTLLLIKSNWTRPVIGW